MCNLTFAFPASRPSKRLRLSGRFRTPCGAVVGAVACPARFAEGLFFSDVSGADQRPSRGRSAGPDFSTMRNRGKNRLGRSPLRTSLGVRGCPCVKPTVGPGTGGVTWMVWQVYGPCPLLCETAPLLPGPYPGVRRGTPQFFMIHSSLFITHNSRPRSRRCNRKNSPAPLSGGWAETRLPQSTPSPHPQCGTPSGCPG